MTDSAATSRVFVFTVGTSILAKSLKGGKTGEDARKAFDQTLDSYQQGKELSEEQKQQIQDYFLSYAGQPELLSANLATVRLEAPNVDHSVASDSDPRIPVRAGDTVFLLASDTLKGKFCAQVDAAMFALIPDVRLHVKTMTKLAVTASEDFERAAATSLSEHIVTAWQEALAKKSTLSFHLSGGYKATIPFIVYLVGHLPAGQVEAEVYLIHEESSVPIRVPVHLTGVDRRLSQDLEAVSEEGTLRHGYWEGYAYRRTAEGGYELTFLGEAISGLAKLAKLE